MTFAAVSRFAGVVVVSGFLAAACRGDISMGPTAVGSMTATFTGTLVEGGSMIHFFTVQQLGTTEIEVVSLRPIASTIIGIGIGSADPSDPTNCIIGAVNNGLPEGAILSRVTSPASTYISVFDVGQIAQGQPIDYVVEVRHP